MQKRIFLYQMLTVLLLTGFGLLFEVVAAVMAFIGSVTSTAGNALFAKWVFGQDDRQDPSVMLGRFYIAELLKIVLTITVLTMALVLIEETKPMALLGAYFVTQFFPIALASLQD